MLYIKILFPYNFEEENFSRSLFALYEMDLFSFNQFTIESVRLEI